MHTLIEGLRIFWQSFRKPARYSGFAEDICQQIVADCWNGHFFQTSLRNYPVFYARDFSMCVEALLQFGYKKEVQQTITFAFNAFLKKGRATQQVGWNGAFDFPNTPSDALAHVLRIIFVAQYKLNKEEKTLLEKEIARYNNLLNAKGLLPEHQEYSGMRDYAIRRSGTADNASIAAIQLYAKKLKLKNENKNNYAKLLNSYWNGTYFEDDVENTHCTGDANVLPIWYGIITDKKKIKQIINYLEKNNFTKPYPLRYDLEQATRMRLQELFVPGWEHDTMWLHLGYQYLDILAQHDKKLHKKHVKAYEQLIQKYHCQPEVLDATGKPYRSWAFRADGTMLWAANFLKHKALKEKTKTKQHIANYA